MHTSDWHIGKKTENVDRLPEQADVLDEICKIAEDEHIELVLIAGDIFDTYVPSADAEELFYEKIVRLASDRAVIIIPGNHDDATRLCAAGPLAGAHNVYFAGNISVSSGEAIGKRKIGPIEIGDGYAVFANDVGEEVYVGMLPYPTEARFKEKSEGNHAERIVGWMNKCLDANKKKRPQILVSHLFTAGGLTSDGEREISLGGAKAVDKNSFPVSAYTALGHLHKRQVVDSKRNIIYSGSILQYAFDEVNVDKSVTVFDLTYGRVENIKEIKLTKGKRLARVAAAGFEQAKELLENYRDYWVELALKIDKPLTREENGYIATVYPNVISVRLEISGSVEYKGESRRQMSDQKLFEECFIKQYGKEPEKELVQLYLELLSEAEEQ